jgi:hypothetical protein
VGVRALKGGYLFLKREGKKREIIDFYYIEGN